MKKENSEASDSGSNITIVDKNLEEKKYKHGNILSVLSNSDPTKTFIGIYVALERKYGSKGILLETGLISKCLLANLFDQIHN